MIARLTRLTVPQRRSGATVTAMTGFAPSAMLTRATVPIRAARVHARTTMTARIPGTTAFAGPSAATMLTRGAVMVWATGVLA
jgi:hypothetical protein